MVYFHFIQGSPQMPQQFSDFAVSQEITDINREFLSLLASAPEGDVEQVLGLDGGAVTALRRLDENQLDMIARAPLLLAEFSPFPGFCEIREIVTRTYPDTQPVWQQQLRGFADRLLACIWQTAKHNKLTMSLYTGIASDRCRSLSDMSFCHLSRYSDLAVHTLRVRLADHPGF